MKRYSAINKKRSEAGKEVYVSMVIPLIEPEDSDIYITTNDTDRLDDLATNFYGNPRYWIVLAVVNNLGKGTLSVAGGIQLRVPINPTTILRQIEEANK